MKMRPILLTACCLLLLAGCGDPRRQAVEGTVTVDGRPLESGSINFRPHPGTSGPTAGANIENGRFTIRPEDGTFVGDFRVEINALRPTGRKVFNELTGESSEGFEQFLPSRYNSQSELAAEVRADGPNRFTFELTTE